MESTTIENFTSVRQLEAITCSKDKFIVLKIDDEYMECEETKHLYEWFQERGIDCIILRDFTETSVCEFEDIAEVEMFLFSQYRTRKKRKRNGC